MIARLLLLLIIATALTSHSADDVFTWYDTIKDDPIKNAALAVFSNDCGTLSPSESKRFAEQSRILSEAGPKAIPAIAELIPSKYCSAWFVGGAARYAIKYPFSESLRTALRNCRDDKRFVSDPAGLNGVFYYFSVFGDQSDLEWLQSITNRMDEPRLGLALKAATQLRNKLAKKNES